MNGDMRRTVLHSELREYFERVHGPNAGSLADASDVQASFDERFIAVGGSVYEPLEGPPKQRILVFELEADGAVIRAAIEGAAPRWSPRAGVLAYIADSAGRGALHLYGTAARAGTAHATQLQESVEALEWAPDGTRILLQTVDAGADRAGAQGSGRVASGDGDRPAWFPHTESVQPRGWRRLWLYVPASGALQSVRCDLTVWEAAWCGTGSLVAVASDKPGEAAWHDARLVHISLNEQHNTAIYRPSEEIGIPIASEDGRFAAFVEACCSDRTVVAGEIVVLERANGWNAKRVAIDADVTALARRGDRVSFAGLRGFQVVAGEVDLETATAQITQVADGSWLRRYPGAVPVGDRDYITVAHSYRAPPKLVRLSPNGATAILHDFKNEGAEHVLRGAGDLRRVTWQSRDGVTMQGYLALPESEGPHRLLVAVHGGPVWAFMDAWQMFYQFTPLLVSRGYAVFHPNPRGSSGRGQAFIRLERGDVGGEETHDILCGVDMLVREGIADANRLAIMGASHGGYMAAWMVTQTPRFAAAVAVSPVTDLFSCHYTSSDPDFDRIFIGPNPRDTAGRHFSRSPIMFAERAKTPTLLVAGGEDRCTPPGQAVEFHRALLENGVESELVIYPKEGHGVREFDAFVDYATRVMGWLDSHLIAAAETPGASLREAGAVGGD